MITRNEALSRLREYHELSLVDPETAHCLADSVLVEIVDDEEIRSAYRAATRHDVLGEITMFQQQPEDDGEGF